MPPTRTSIRRWPLLGALAIALALGAHGAGAVSWATPRARGERLPSGPVGVAAGATAPIGPAGHGTAAGTAPPAVDAHAYAVYDATAGRELAGSHADERLPVGSLLKLLNASVAYAAGDPERVVVAPAGLGGADDESVLGIEAGERATRAVLIRAMLKVSANDAARLLALDIAGSEARYAALMNAAAADLGLHDTHAVNASGLDADGQFSSARDLVRLAQDLLRDATFRATVAEPTARFDGEVHPNTNGLLGTYRGADGIKTGHTARAGWCLLGSATRGGRRILVVVLGAPTEQARVDEAAALLDWGFAQP